MKARYRGGPMNKRIGHVKDGTPMVLVSRPLPLVWTDDLFPGTLMDVQNGQYTRALAPFKDGSYAFIWLGWDDE